MFTGSRIDWTPTALPPINTMFHLRGKKPEQVSWDSESVLAIKCQSRQLFVEFCYLLFIPRNRNWLCSVGRYF
jgi:hypothetical protein